MRPPRFIGMYLVPAHAEPTLLEIRRAVCKQFGITQKEILCGGRGKIRVVRPRQVGMYLARRATRKSYLQIARSFGLTDHATAMHAAREVDRLRAGDLELDGHIRALEGRL